MYLSTPDALFFQDGAGLTRLGSDGAVKTGKAWAGGMYARMGLDEAGGLLSVCCGQLQALLDPVTLKTKHRYKKSAFSHPRIHADGAHIFQFHRDWRKSALLEVHHRSAASRWRDLLASHDLSGASTWPRERLGEQAPYRGPVAAPSYRAPLSRLVHGPGRRFLAFCMFDSQLISGTWSDPLKPPVIDWRWSVDIHQGAWLTLSAHPDGDVVVVTDAKLQRAFGVRIAGGERQRFTVPAITPPTVLGQSLLYQPDDDTVVLRSLVDGAETKTTLSSLPKHRDLPSPGPATLMLWEGRPMVLPWHGEGILDVCAGRMINRKLPAASRGFRLTARRILLRHAAAGRPVSIFAELGTVTANRTTYSISAACTTGDIDFAGFFVGNTISNTWEHPEIAAHGLEPKSCGVAAVHRPTVPVDAADVAHALRICKAHGIVPRDHLGSLLANGMYRLTTGEAPFTPAAAAGLLDAALGEGKWLDCILGLSRQDERPERLVKACLYLLVVADGPQATAALLALLGEPAVSEALMLECWGFLGDLAGRLFERHPHQRAVVRAFMAEREPLRSDTQWTYSWREVWEKSGA